MLTPIYLVHSTMVCHIKQPRQKGKIDMVLINSFIAVLPDSQAEAFIDEGNIAEDSKDSDAGEELVLEVLETEVLKLL